MIDWLVALCILVPLLSLAYDIMKREWSGEA